MQNENLRGGDAVTAPSPEAIARRAYELFERRGREPGHELEDWLGAEAELSRAEGVGGGVSTPVADADDRPPDADKRSPARRTAQPKRRPAERNP